MDTSQNPDSQARNQLAVEDAVQDQIISQRLPQWLRAASVDEVTAVGEALRLSLYFRQRVSEELARIQRLDQFALPLLEKALEAHLGAPVDAHRWTFRVGHREPVINAQPVGYHLTEVVYTETSRIEAALRNFTAEQTTEGGQPRGNRVMSARQGTIKPPSALAFAALCRELDLGGQYQRHLDQVLNPAEIQGEPTPRFASLLARSQRYAMLVDTYVAKFQGALSDSEHQFLVKLCLLRQPTHLDGHPVIANNSACSAACWSRLWCWRSLMKVCCSTAPDACWCTFLVTRQGRGVRSKACGISPTTWASDCAYLSTNAFSVASCVGVTASAFSPA